MHRCTSVCLTTLNTNVHRDGLKMIDQIAIATATAAAGNVIAYMLNGHIDVLRGKIAQLFQRNNDEDETAILEQLDADALALSRRKLTKAELKAKWSAMFTALLASNPETCDELGAFANTPVENKSVNVGSQHNHGLGTFIAGDNHGDINMAGRNDR